MDNNAFAAICPVCFSKIKETSKAAYCSPSCRAGAWRKSQKDKTTKITGQQKIEKIVKSAAKCHMSYGQYMAFLKSQNAKT